MENLIENVIIDGGVDDTTSEEEEDEDEEEGGDMECRVGGARGLGGVVDMGGGDSGTKGGSSGSRRHAGKSRPRVSSPRSTYADTQHTTAGKLKDNASTLANYSLMPNKHSPNYSSMPNVSFAKSVCVRVIKCAINFVEF